MATKIRSRRTANRSRVTLRRRPRPDPASRCATGTRSAALPAVDAYYGAYPRITSIATGVRTMTKVAVSLLLVLFVAAQPAGAQRPPDTVFLEDLTWDEVRDLIASGRTSVIIATAGTEQNGPHMVLGKHRYIIEYAADRI